MDGVKVILVTVQEPGISLRSLLIPTSVLGRMEQELIVRLDVLISVWLNCIWNLAECYAALENTTEALANLNEIRGRAGLKELTDADLTGDMTLMDWVRNERFVELYEEGFRYYDVRRWMIAPTMLKAGVRYGLNGLAENPSFERI